MVKINYFGPMNTTGYGVASMGYACGLKSLGLDINFIPIAKVDPEDNDLQKPEYVHLFKDIKHSPETGCPSVIFWHAHDLQKYYDVMPDGPKIAITTFEVDKLKPAEIAQLKKFDAVGTASQWGVEILKNQLPDKKLFVAHHAFKFTDKDIVPELKNESPIPTWSNILCQPLLDDTFCITSSGKFEIRKGHPELLDAALDLGKDFPVLLSAFWTNPFIADFQPYTEIHKRDLEPVFNERGIRLYRRDNAYIALMPRTPSRIELHGALARSHVFCAPSRGEGWNLPLFELMSYGHLCSATPYSGHSEYVTEKNSIQIPCRDNNIDSDDVCMETAADGIFFDGTGRWFSVTSEEVKDSLLKARDLIKSGEADKIKKQARLDTAKFTWQKAAKQIMTILNEMA